MTTAIVILNWNGASYLQQFLPILIENTTLPGAEIIVVDNASTDSSLAILKAEFPTIKTIVLDKNYGFAGGYNKALAQIDADYYVLLNSDVEVTANWLEPLIGYMEQHEEVAACQPKIRSYHQRTHFEHAGAAGGYIDKYGFPFCRGRVLGFAEEDKGQYDTVADIHILISKSGVCHTHSRMRCSERIVVEQTTTWPTHNAITNSIIKVIFRASINIF
jgi:GT2 family glycosyltransferase